MVRQPPKDPGSSTTSEGRRLTVDSAVTLPPHSGLMSRRCMAAEEVRQGMIRAFSDGDLARARRLETHYEALMETCPEEFAADHD